MKRTTNLSNMYITVIVSFGRCFCGVQIVSLRQALSQQRDSAKVVSRDPHPLFDPQTSNTLDALVSHICFQLNANTVFGEH